MPMQWFGCYKNNNDNADAEIADRIINWSHWTQVCRSKRQTQRRVTATKSGSTTTTTTMSIFSTHYWYG